MEVGHLLVEWRGATSRLAGLDGGGGYHRPVCVETVVVPLHHFSVEGVAENNRCHCQVSVLGRSMKTSISPESDKL